ncbi:DUF6476 family protein [Maliponia aquimaris]|uniref:Uncharacterized protein n=1 Tax=Maliponia aquimaris TaxID=1673631 RepID=A0A238KM66_9RHOB|nr:DUF6476 family protein [Maliponia aquimaris]SMX43172.1 hypothetical protein MAA8898_02759 [Maliponia aquimaris]
MASPDPEDDDLPLPPSLRFLRALVTLLTAVMIAGILGILALIWSRYSNASAPLPEVITLPDGARASTFTQGPDWYAVVTTDDEILIFDRATGKLRQTLRIAPAE